jgi:MFS family permease
LGLGVVLPCCGFSSAWPIGSEWATGASIVSELWPDHARGKGGGLLQCGAGLGSILASLVWLAITSETLGGAIGAAGPSAWRYLGDYCQSLGRHVMAARESGLGSAIAAPIRVRRGN